VPSARWRRRTDYTIWLSLHPGVEHQGSGNERLASEIADLTGESKSGAVRQALRERRQRLLLARSGRGRGDRMVDLLERQWWPRLLVGVRGTSLSKEDEEAILGLGPEGP